MNSRQDPVGVFDSGVGGISALQAMIRLLPRKDGSILVLATPLTLQQDKFVQLMEKYGDGAVKVPCPGLMELVEKDDMEGSEAYLRRVFSRYDMRKVDAVVLGCTHYVFLKDMIRRMIPEGIAITEGSDGTARQLKRVLQRNGLLAEDGEGWLKLETSGTDRDIQIMRRLLDFPL